MKRSVLLSTFLFAAVLAPILLQSNECSTESHPKLSRLELYVPDINGQNVIQNFNPEYVLHEVDLPIDPPDTAVLLVQAQNTTATIEVTYDSVPISLGPNGVAPLTLAPDHSEIRVTVTAEDGKAWTYTVSIDRVDYCPCDDANECTYDICYPAGQVCVYRAVPDGTYCGGGTRGNCFGGVCNFVPVSVAIGPKEIVFDWTTDRCEDYDLPDVPAKAARAEDGELVLFANHAPINRVMRGPDFDTLQHLCDPPALVSADLLTPDSYENREWLWSIYREGPTWHALIHNEFHDPVATTCKPGDPSTANPCAYISVTYAASVDGARSFAKPSPPAHVVAPHTEVWTPPTEPLGFYSIVGYTGASDIVRGQDGYYYALLWRDVSSFTDEGYLCLMRTSNLHDPASWRAWDGTGFDIRMESPYVTGEPAVPCARLPSGGGMASLTYNTYLDLYMIVNNGGDPSGAGAVCGIYLWLSRDLIYWSDAQLIAPARIVGCDPGPETPGLLDPLEIWLPSIIDHADSTTNFERPGQTPYLYYTRFNDGGLDRDLVRVPLTFTREE